eukprot:TRINITY_DN18453_c0_g1_i1.p1 TRINITY_DN18453_c0_g1~~TRINITY_DN18453_c0_g1_i1.p1  ORF type:complete len:191 (+),score=38.97 TRINITY_DN18453_c0_g1_i1:74-646(+)
MSDGVGALIQLVGYLVVGALEIHQAESRSMNKKGCKEDNCSKSSSAANLRLKSAIDQQSVTLARRAVQEGANPDYKWANSSQDPELSATEHAWEVGCFDICRMLVGSHSKTQYFPLTSTLLEELLWRPDLRYDQITWVLGHGQFDKSSFRLPRMPTHLDPKIKSLIEKEFCPPSYDQIEAEDLKKPGKTI